MKKLFFITIKEGYEEFNNNLLGSLKSAVAVKDDF